MAPAAAALDRAGDAALSCRLDVSAGPALAEAI